GSNLDIDAHHGYSHTPPRGIAPTPRADPVVEYLYLDVLARNRSHLAGRAHPGSSAVRVPRTIAIAQRIKHQRAAVMQLECEPVPALLVRAQRPAAPFPIEPGQAVNLHRMAAAHEPTGHRHARNGVVVTGRARLVGLAAQPGLAVEHRGAEK